MPDRAINFGHALKNTLVPVITVIGLQLGAIIAFAIITETVFQWPGMGLMFIQAVQNADIPVMAAYLLLVAFLFVLINFIVDLIYVRIDPRIRIHGAWSVTDVTEPDAGLPPPPDPSPQAGGQSVGGRGSPRCSTAICSTASGAPSWWSRPRS